MAKDSVIFYQAQVKICKEFLTTEQFGRLMGALFTLNDGEEPEVDDDIAMAFAFMSLQQRLDREKYEHRCQVNRENAKKGGAPKGNQNAKKQPKQPNAKKNNPNDNDNDNDNDNENENDNEHSSPSVIIKYLNSKTGADYNLSTTESVELINDLIESGYDIDDLKKVVDKKCAEWLEDKTMRSYLRPSTLFGPKFAEYLAAPEPMKSEAERKKTEDIKSLRHEYKLKQEQLDAVRETLSDPKVVERSLTDINSLYYEMKDKEYLLEQDLLRLNAKMSALGG